MGTEESFQDPKSRTYVDNMWVVTTILSFIIIIVINNNIIIRVRLLDRIERERRCWRMTVRKGERHERK